MALLQAPPLTYETPKTQPFSSADPSPNAGNSVQRTGETPLTTGLAAYVKSCFEEARNHKDSVITPRLLKCHRQRDGEYEAEIQAAIQAMGGCKEFFNITDTKCSAAEAWIEDALMPVTGQAFAFEPTPVADIPPEDRGYIVEGVATEITEEVMAGMPSTARDVDQRTMEKEVEVRKKIQDEAVRRAGDMEKAVFDVMLEGNYYGALREFINSICTFPAGILKGPNQRKIRRMEWGKSGGQEVVEDIIPYWYCVSPYDFYPSPESHKPSDGYVCEKVSWNKPDLSRMRGVDGYSTEEIDAVLGEESRFQIETQDRTERERMESRDSQAAKTSSKVEAIEFWGSVQGNLLAEWGMAVEDEGAFYEICALMIGNHVVRAIFNPDPLGEKPYWVSSYKKKAGNLWGVGIPEMMDDCQAAVNAALRATVNNLAWASAPMMAVDTAQVDPSERPRDIHPRRVLLFNSMRSMGKGTPPVYPIQIQPIIGELKQVAEYFERKADDRTLIPRYAHGNDAVGGAGQTASGLDMLMGAASKGIKSTIHSLDEDVFKPSIDSLVRWLREYKPSPVLEGDIRVQSRGATEAIQREQTIIRQMNLLNVIVANPVLQEITGVEGMRALLSSIARRTNLGVDDVVLSKEMLEAKTRAAQRAQMMQQAGMVPPQMEGAPALPGANGPAAPAEASTPQSPEPSMPAGPPGVSPNFRQPAGGNYQ